MGVFAVFSRRRPESTSPRLLVPTAALAFLAVTANALMSTHAGGQIPGILHVLTAISAAGVTGGVLATMIVGHWYLVRPRLPIRYLRWFFRFFIAAFIVRIVLLALAIVPLIGTPQLTRLVSFSDMIYASSLSLFFYVRVLFGIAGPVGFSWMIWQTIRIRSTQSATGLLYLLTLFVLIGEATALYLSRVTGLPL